MEIFAIVFGVLLAGLSAADPPEGLYIAEGVTYVGCFEHGDTYHEVLEVQISYSADCAVNKVDSCLTPPTCIDWCLNTNRSYVYIGLKFPGQCFCDSVLRGVNQTDSVDWVNCDARCRTPDGVSQFACGSTNTMLVYQLSSITPLMTTHSEMPTSSVSYKTTEAGATETSSKGTNERPQSSTAIIAGAAAGGAAVLIVAGSVVAVCIWRKKSGRRQTNKQSSSLALRDDPIVHPPLDPNTNPTAPPNPSNIDALYAKPDKKRKQKKSSPDDPSYQDVVPTGAQNQYATGNEDYPPNTMVQQGSNPYDSIQTDPQYAVVKKGRRHRPNVDVNPIYMGGSDEANSLNQENADMLGMVDNIIYE